MHFTKVAAIPSIVAVWVDVDSLHTRLPFGRWVECEIPRMEAAMCPLLWPAPSPGSLGLSTEKACVVAFTASPAANKL